MCYANCMVSFKPHGCNIINILSCEQGNTINKKGYSGIMNFNNAINLMQSLPHLLHTCAFTTHIIITVKYLMSTKNWNGNFKHNIFAAVPSTLQAYSFHSFIHSLQILFLFLSPLLASLQVKCTEYQELPNFIRATPHVSVRLLLYFTAVIFSFFFIFSFPPA